MGKIRMRSTSISDNPSLQSPVFHFSPYVADGNHTYYNNEDVIDFVTDGNSLYVCLSHDGVTPTYENIEDNGDFLKIVSQGPQGIRGPRGHDGDSAETPRLNAEFDNDQLRVYVNGELETVSPRLTGKAWRPKLEDNMIVWELSNKMYSPEPIDLEELRPTQEKPLLLRVDSDNTKRSDETSGPAGFIQWKYEGDPHWTNLISISELMNLTLAGVSIWKNDEGKWHFGHKKVIGATYESDKVGNRIISKVELGDVLFDAGELPFEENSETRPDYSIDIDLIYTRLAEIEVAMVKSVNGFGPDSDGNVNINIPNPDLTNYATKAWTTDNFQPKGNYLTQHQSLDGLVRQVRVNGTTHSPVDGTVDLGDIGGSSGTPTDTSDCIKGITVNNGSTVYRPDSNTGIANIQVSGGSVDTSDCVKSVTINNNTQTPNSSNNGHLVFTIDLGGNPLFDVRFDNSTHKLQKTIDGQTWLDLVDLDDYIGSITPSTGGLTEAEVKTLIGKILEGIEDYIPTEYVRNPSHNYFIRINDLGTSLSNYYTKEEINTIISGLTGVTPDTYAQWRPFSVYMRTQNDTAPQKPGVNDWRWYPNVDNKLHGASGSDVNVVNNWINDVPAATSSTPYLWVSWNSFSNLTGTNGGTEWSTPAQMNGGHGSDGEDGSGIKFIFKLAANSSSTVTAPVGIAPEFDNTWSDSATGIDLDHKVEYYCYSTFNGDSWSAWQGPFIWSLWGENGVDGNGVEYIYLHQGSANIASNNDPSKLATSVLNSIDYQSPDYVPEIGDALISGTLGVDWTDEPSGVNSEYTYEFVSVRKYDGTTKRWGPFSEPKVWAHFGANGVGLVENNLIVPTSTTVSKVEVTTNNQTSYKVAGTITWNIYHNDEQVTNGYCEAYLGSYTSGTSLTVTNSSGNYSATVNQNWNDIAFLQIVWYEGNNNQGKLLDSVLVPVIIPGVKGADGTDGVDGSVQSLDGPIMRIRQYNANTQYYAEDDPVDGIYYLDIVYYESNNKGNYYKCISSCKGVTPSSNSQYWTPYSFLGDAAFESLLAKYAYIQDLTAKQVVITDNNTIVAGMTSGTVVGTDLENEVTPGNVRIWAGPTTNGDLTTAPFRVTDQGVLYATGANVSGHIEATSGSFQFLKINGQNISNTNSLGIRFGNANTATTEANTIYFLYE